jgi:hypothetical protein
VNWLYLIGLAFDGVGAMLIAWPILRPGSAVREMARPRWGGDHWASFRRDRELRLVQYGALSLVLGFILQATGYVIRVGDSWWWLAITVVVAILVVGLAAGNFLAQRRLPKHVWHAELPPSRAIGDGLHTYGVSNTVDLEKVVRRSILETRGIAVEAITERSIACVEGGTWKVYCPRCHQPTAATTPTWAEAICTACGARFGVAFPSAESRMKIEAELLTESDPEQRRWVGQIE